MILTFNIKQKLGGLGFRSLEDRMAELMNLITEGNGFAGLKAGQHWHVMEALLTGKHNNAVRELGTRGISSDATKRLNNRLELLREIEEDMSTAIRRGADAQGRYAKLREKEQRHAR